MRPNITKRKLEAGDVVLGTFVTIPEPALIELCGYAGFDFIVIDAEHGPITEETCVNMVRAAEIHDLTPLVRVPKNSPEAILRFLDIGAQGIVVPRITTPEDADRAVRSVKFSPLGSRGVGLGRAAGYGQLMPLNEYAAKSNRETMVVALLEHIQVIENLDAILAVEGIDVFMVGWADLSQSMGLLGQTSHPEVQSVATTITDRVLGAGRVMGAKVQDVETATKLVDQGFLWLHVSLNDLIGRKARQFVGSIRSQI